MIYKIEVLALNGDMDNAKYRVTYASGRRKEYFKPLPKTVQDVIDKNGVSILKTWEDHWGNTVYEMESKPLL